MKHSTRTFAVAVLAACLAVSAAPAAFAQGGSVTGNKTVASSDINCDGSTTVTVTLNGQTGLAGDPEDIMLVLDRSGSMGGQPLADLKTAASLFVDIIDEATDGSLDGVIANGSRVGVVSFATSASVDVGLTADANDVKAAISGLAAGGGTNHEDAISMAQAELAVSEPSNSKQMLIFTDGQTTAGGDPDDDAAAARAAGTEIFAIGLGDVNVAQLNEWATNPDSSHVFIAPSSSDLQAIFQAIGAAIVVPAGTNITVVDTVTSHFAVSGAAVSRGVLNQAGNVLTWTINELRTESVTLTYTITHDATQPGGVEAVNSSITYSDAEGHVVSFPSPTVNVRGCAAAIDVTPDSATNELGTPGQGHSVVGTVTDDFGDPVANVLVDFDILSGPNAGANGSDTTDAAGEAHFSYTATQGLAGLGQDVIRGCFTNGQGVDVCDQATKDWVDTTAPVVRCSPTTNPSGNNVPPAGTNPSSGQNPDGFYVLTATDAVDPNPRIFVRDSATSFVAGPYASGTKIKLVQAPGANPNVKLGVGAIDWKITLKGDALVSAVDASGNTSTVTCRVPPPPK